MGFSGGFRFAGHLYDQLPFDVVWANDISEAACRTYCLNLDHPIHEGDIANLISTMPDSADAVIGGFPCQDVSINGLRKAESGKRTVLYRYMVEAIRRTRPKVFVAENVKGLLMSHGRPFFDRMLDEFSLDGYTVNYRLYLAADYGVPQMRERTFIIGVKGGGRSTIRNQTPDESPRVKPSPISKVYQRVKRLPMYGAKLPEVQNKGIGDYVLTNHPLRFEQSTTETSNGTIGSSVVFHFGKLHVCNHFPTNLDSPEG